MAAKKTYKEQVADQPITKTYGEISQENNPLLNPSGALPIQPISPGWYATGEEAVAAWKAKELQKTQDIKNIGIDIPTPQQIIDNQAQELPIGSPFKMGVSYLPAGTPTEKLTIGETIKQQVSGVFQNAAQIYDIIASGISNKQSGAFRQTQATLADATAALRNDIASVKAGAISIDDAQRNYEQAVIALNRMEKVAQTIKEKEFL